MPATKRSFAVSILLCVATAGCTPANYVRTLRPGPQSCDVRVCLNPHSGVERCDCQTTEHTQRQLREAGLLQSQ
jgi:hypothetical protein